MAGSNGRHGLQQYEDWVARQKALDKCTHPTTRTERRGSKGQEHDVTVCATCGDVVT